MRNCQLVAFGPEWVDRETQILWKVWYPGTCLLHVYMRIVMASVSVLTYQAFVDIGPPALGIGSVIQPTFLLNVTMCSSWTGHSDDSHSFHRLLSQRPHPILVFAFTCQFFPFYARILIDEAGKLSLTNVWKSRVVSTMFENVALSLPIVAC